MAGNGRQDALITWRTNGILRAIAESSTGDGLKISICSVNAKAVRDAVGKSPASDCDAVAACPMAGISQDSRSRM